MHTPARSAPAHQHLPGHHPSPWPRTQPRVPPRKPIVPYVPTAESIVEAMLDLARVGPDDVLYDLGCGDGRIVIGAARRGARGVGIDIDRLRVREGNWNAQRANVTDRVAFRRESLYDVDVRPATVVTLYLLPSINKKLRPRLLRELRTGSRIVSNYFDMDDWQPDARSETRGRILLMWIVPAWVEGQWKCVTNAPEGRSHLVLRLRRKYQKVTGTAQVGRKEVLIDDGRLAGDRFTFAFKDPATARRLRCEARVTGNEMRGTCGVEGTDDALTWAWAGFRETATTTPS